MKKQDGLSMIALILILVIVGTIIFIGVRYIKQYINNEKNEDIKTTMLFIQGKTTEIRNKHEVDSEANLLIGEKLDLENTSTEYNISQELKDILINIEDSDIYVLSKEDLDNIGLKDIEVNNNEFYMVDYNSEDIFYSLGINGKYKLSDLETKKEDNDVENNEKVESTETTETEANETEANESEANETEANESEDESDN